MLKQRDEAGFDVEGLVALGRYLKSKGYQFTTVTPLTHAHYVNQKCLAEDLRDVFGWSLPFRQSLITDMEWQLIEKAGVFESYGENWRSTVRWSSLDDLLLIHSAYPTDEPDAVFFGPDTYRFIRLIKEFLKAGPEIGRAVDIGSGTGAGAIALARQCPQAAIVAVDINPLALQFCSVNAQLASVDHIEPALSDLLAGVEGDFDLIVANPAYMLDAQNRSYRQGGGTFGEALSWRIVETALDRLNPGGSLLLYTGVVIVNGEDIFQKKLKALLPAWPCRWSYEEIDPDVFGEELIAERYSSVERIAVIGLKLTLVR